MMYTIEMQSENSHKYGTFSLYDGCETAVINQSPSKKLFQVEQIQGKVTDKTS